MIDLCQVTKREDAAGRGLLLDAVDLAVRPHEVVLLAGPSGSGKSTLLGLCYGAVRPDAGTVAVFGRDLSRLRRSSLQLLRRCVGIVPQAPRLLFDYSAQANVALALEVRGEPRRTMRERALAWLERVGLADQAATAVRELSVRQRQWVAIARALVGEPAALFADEPSAHFDPDSHERFIEIVSTEQARGMAAILATNDHKLLCAGAHHGWRHVELHAGALEMIADRTVARTSSEVRMVDIDDYEDIEITAEGDADVRTDDIVPNVVPFPISASIGGVSR